MKNRIFGLLLTVVCSNALASWELVRNSPGEVKVFLDRAKIERTGNLVRVWSLFDLASAQASPSGLSFLSTTSHVEFDCSNRTRRMISVNFYDSAMGGGQLVSKRQFKKGQSRF
ncbi:MAG: surface-adhesin E family protein, partial [Quisquiliibacterium sp.]